MGVVLSQTSDGQVIDVDGVVTGHVLLRRHDVTFRGSGRATATLRADGTYTSLFQAAFPPQTLDGQPVRKIIVEDMTLDTAGISSLTSAVQSNLSSGPVVLELNRVDIVNTHKNTRGVSCAGEGVLTDVSVVGAGGGVQAAAGCTRVVIRNCTVRGGSLGFVCSDGATEIPGIDIDGLDVVLDYWCSPTYESVTVTGFGAQYVDVASHVSAHRRLYDVLRISTPVGTYNGTLAGSGAQDWDRLETVDGRWTQVVNGSVGPWHAAGTWSEVVAPAESATVYRVVLGRLMSWTDTRLSLVTGQGVPTLAHWRTVTGGNAGTPTLAAGVRVDILRHGATGGPRDVDTGGVHVTKTGTGAVLRNVTVRGGFSDMFTTRAPGVVVEDCSVDLGQDMGFTVDGGIGPQIIRRCAASRAGFCGFWLGVGPSILEDCQANGNGMHASGDPSGWGVYVDPSAAGSSVHVTGSGNVLGLAKGIAQISEDDSPRAATLAVHPRYEVAELQDGRHQVAIDHGTYRVLHAGLAANVEVRTDIDATIADRAAIASLLPGGN